MAKPKCFLSNVTSFLQVVNHAPILSSQGTFKYQLKVAVRMPYVATAKFHDISSFCNAWSAAAMYSSFQLCQLFFFHNYVEFCRFFKANTDYNYKKDYLAWDKMMNLPSYSVFYNLKQFTNLDTSARPQLTHYVSIIEMWALNIIFNIQVDSRKLFVNNSSVKRSKIFNRTDKYLLTFMLPAHDRCGDVASPTCG
jgi:hypothetical protein